MMPSDCKLCPKPYENDYYIELKIILAVYHICCLFIALYKRQFVDVLVLL